MSVNTAHANGGVLIHSGEYILLHTKHASIEFSGQKSHLFEATKYGHVYLTTHRIIFKSKRQTDPLQSFSAPFIAMSDVKIEQPTCSATFIKSNVRAQLNGNFLGEVQIKVNFKSGGAPQFGQALLCAASMALSHIDRTGKYLEDIPEYTPSRAWYEAPLTSYQRPPGYYDWLPTNEVFTNPRPNSVFMSDNPAPYPGIGTPTKQEDPTGPCRPFATPYLGGPCPTRICKEHPFNYGVLSSSTHDELFSHRATYPAQTFMHSHPIRVLSKVASVYHMNIKEKECTTFNSNECSVYDTDGSSGSYDYSNCDSTAQEIYVYSPPVRDKTRRSKGERLSRLTKTSTEQDDSIRRSTDQRPFSLTGEELSIILSTKSKQSEILTPAPSEANVTSLSGIPSSQINIFTPSVEMRMSFFVKSNVDEAEILATPSGVRLPTAMTNNQGGSDAPQTHKE